MRDQHVLQLARTARFAGYALLGVAAFRIAQTVSELDDRMERWLLLLASITYFAYFTRKGLQVLLERRRVK